MAVCATHPHQTPPPHTGLLRGCPQGHDATSTRLSSPSVDQWPVTVPRWRGGRCHQPNRLPLHRPASFSARCEKRKPVSVAFAFMTSNHPKVRCAALGAGVKACHGPTHRQLLASLFNLLRARRVDRAQVSRARVASGALGRALAARPKLSTACMLFAGLSVVGLLVPIATVSHTASAYSFKLHSRHRGVRAPRRPH